jgi:hypothetical protein
MADREHIPASDLWKYLTVDFDNGILTWRPREGTDRLTKTWNTKHAGQQAFTYQRTDGYFVGAILNHIYRAHRVILAMALGYWPDEGDHINGVRSDNRLINLREVDSAGNKQNMAIRSDSPLGVHGVQFIPDRGLYMARLSQKFIGYFATKTEAIAARLEAEKAAGYHQNHGRDS